MNWPPPDLDPEVRDLCEAMNAFDGITTTESCCGHGERQFRIWFTAARIASLPGLLYWTDKCHTGLDGWAVRVRTDCAARYPAFCLEGPAGPDAYGAAAFMLEGSS